MILCYCYIFFWTKLLNKTIIYKCMSSSVFIVHVECLNKNESVKWNNCYLKLSTKLDKVLRSCDDEVWAGEDQNCKADKWTMKIVNVKETFVCSDRHVQKSKHSWHHICEICTKKEVILWFLLRWTVPLQDCICMANHT